MISDFLKVRILQNVRENTDKSYCTLQSKSSIVIKVTISKVETRDILGEDICKVYNC